MEMLNSMSEMQKSQFEELKDYVARCLEEIDGLKTERDSLRCLHEEEKQRREDIQAERDEVKNRLNQSTESYLREFSEAKIHWDAVEENLRSTTENIQKELMEFEEHNKVLNEKLISLENELINVTKKEQNVREELGLVKKREESLLDENTKLKKEFEVVSNDLHQAKMKLLQDDNLKDNLRLEIKRYKKAAEAAIQKLTASVEEKNLVFKSNEDLTQAVLKNKAVEGEIKDVKFYLNILGKGNGTINSKLDSILSRLLKDNKSVGVQTELTNKQLSEYDNLDREATMLVMKMREELIMAKDELLAVRQENGTLRNFVRDAKRDREMREEEERVEKLEEAVKALGDLVSKEQNRPSREDTIIKKLTEVKRDLDMIKSSTKSKKDPENMDLTTVPIKLVSNRYSRK